MKKKILIAIPCILIIIVLIILFAKTAKLKNNINISDDIIEENNKYDGYIDFKNLENAEIKDGVKYNTSKKIKEDHIAGNYKFKDMEIYSNDCCSVLKFNISKSDNKETDNEIVIEFYDKNKSIVYDFELWLKQKDIKKGTIESEIPKDIINSYDYKVFGLG